MQGIHIPYVYALASSVQMLMSCHGVCSPESKQGSPNVEKDGLGLEALAQLASPASSQPQTLAGRSQASALAQLADVEGSSWGPKGAHAPSKYGSLSADLDFDEFLERQQRFLEVCMLPNCLVDIRANSQMRLWHLPSQRTPLGCNLVSTVSIGAGTRMQDT